MYELSDNGQSVFDARLAARNMNGDVIESFDQAVKRIAEVASLAEDERTRDKLRVQFEEVIGNRLLIPSTPIWANMGKDDRPWQPGACFVLDVQDSLHSMYQTMQNAAMIFKSGGGVGYNFSKIRPSGTIVRSTKGQASGVVELVKLYDASSNMVKQGGVRRGASIAILNVDHPEIVEFINCKRDGGIENFNLSVGITDKFMKAVEEDKEWVLKFKIRRKTIKHSIIRARELWDMICESAWVCGDPGIIFIDRLQEGNPVPTKVIWATNPCGEQPLYFDESCLLASINLAEMVQGGKFNWSLFRSTVRHGIHFLDNILDVAQYPSKRIADATRATRKVGLGFTGLGDTLIKLGLAYNSDEGRKYAGKITAKLREEADYQTAALAGLKGCFPDWDKSIFYPDKPRRNAACVTIAPTGSVTAIGGCEAYGVEPIFGVSFTKETKVAGRFVVFSPLFLEKCKEHNVPQAALDVVARKGSCQNVDGIPNEIQALFVGGHEMDLEDHILMQAEVQKHVDNAVSKTINLPNSATAEDVGKAYYVAYNLGLKGMTIWRHGCKDGVVQIGLDDGEAAEVPVELARGEIKKRPRVTVGPTERLTTGCGKLYLDINHDPQTGEIVETFITTGSDGGCLIFTEATSRLISLAIRGGIPIEEIVEQLKGTHPCPSYTSCRAKGKDVSPGKSCPSAIANKLLEAYKNNVITIDLAEPGTLSDGKRLVTGPRELKLDDTIPCPECGVELQRAEGCMVCINCGYSKC